ncbi:MAG: YciI family protein [Coprobacillus sp.]
MNKYVVILSNKAKGTLKEALLFEHVEHLKLLKKQGKLFICGPFEDNDNAIQIIIAKNKREAEEIILSDPFIVNHYYRDFSISTLIEANDENNYLMEDTQTKLNKYNKK